MATTPVILARPRLLVSAAAIVSLAAFAYSPLPRNGSVGIDDDPIVFENPAVVAGLGVTAVEYAFTNTEIYFQPLALISLAADRSLFGLDPRAFHGVNWALHVATALVLLFALASATGRIAAAAAVAAAFAAHPVNVEAVAWAAERRTVLAGLLGIASCVAYGSWARRGGAGRYALSLLTFVLSLFSKALLLPLPAMLVALDVWPLRRAEGGGGRWRRIILEKVPFGVASVAVFAVTYVSMDRAGMGGNVPRGAGLRLATAVVAPFHHLGHLAFPSDLTLWYPYPAAPPAGWPLALAAGIAVTVACFRVRARAPWWLAGWCWFLAALVPTLGLIQGGEWPMLADRHAYLAALGPFAAASFQIDAWLHARSPRVRRVAFGVTVATGLVLAATAARQVTFWRDGLTLLTRAVAYAPGQSMLHYSLGLEHARRGQDAEAEHHLVAAARACADRTTGCWMPWRIYTNLSVVHARAGRLDEAIRAAQLAVQAKPLYPEALFNLARLLHASGRFSEAVPSYEAFVRVAPAEMGAARAEVIQILRSSQPSRY